MSDDEDSLFGGSDLEDTPTQTPVTPSLALPTLKRKSPSTASAGSSSRHRVGTIALSQSPLLVSEQLSPAATLITPALDAVRSSSVLEAASPLPPVPGAVVTPIDMARQNTFFNYSMHVATTAGASASNPIVIDDDAPVQSGSRTTTTNRRRRSSSPGPRPRKRPRKSLKEVTSFAVLVQLLRTDRTITTVLQSLMEHVRPLTPQEELARSMLKRVDVTGKEITDMEWRVMKTQELVAALAGALRKGLKKAGVRADKEGRLLLAAGRGRLDAEDCFSTAMTEIQGVIQMWILNRLTSYAVPPPVPAATTPETPVPSSSIPHSITADTMDMTPIASSSSSTAPSVSDTSVDTPIAAEGEHQLNWGAGDLDFSVLEEMFGFSTETSLSQTDPSDISGPGTSLSTSAPEKSPVPIQTIVSDLSSQEPATASTVSDAPLVNPSELSFTLDPVLMNLSYAPCPSTTPNIDTNGDSMDVSHTPQPSAACTPIVMVTAPSDSSNMPTQGKQVEHTSNPGRLDRALTRAQSHREALQQELDRSMKTMWELEIEHATLSRVVKLVTEEQARSSLTDTAL